jgi:membrane-associated phospholipid phosphatase
VTRVASLREGMAKSRLGMFAVLVGSAAVVLLLMVAVGAIDVHVLSHGRIGSEDRAIEADLARHRASFWNSLTKLLTYGAETLPVAVASLVLVVIAAVVFRRWHEPLFVASTLIGEVAIFVATTLLVHRARPAVPELDHAPPTSSFPSGHTAAATALYGAIAVLVVGYGARRFWRVVAVAIAVLVPIAVALSRLYRGMHYPTDVLGGFLLGGTWLLISSRLLLEWGVQRRGGTAYPPAPHARRMHSPQAAPTADKPKVVR